MGANQLRTEPRRRSRRWIVVVVVVLILAAFFAGQTVDPGHHNQRNTVNVLCKYWPFNKTRLCKKK